MQNVNQPNLHPLFRKVSDQMTALVLSLSVLTIWGAIFPITLSLALA